MKKRRACIFSAAVLAAVGILCVWLMLRDEPSAVKLLQSEDDYVFFINVGKGDAILIRSGGKSILIDAGDEEHSESLLSALELAGVEKIDALVVTHGNKDHLGGVKPLSEWLAIEKAYCPKFYERNKKDKNKLKKKLKRLGLDTESVASGDSIQVGEVKLEVLAPAEYIDGDVNDNSVVLRAEIGGISYLFAGDMQFAEEKSLIASGAELKCDVLKVGNHGNDDATSAEFAAAASPAVSVITTSTAEDKGTASVRVRDLLSAYGKYYITEHAEHGILTLVRDGEITVLYV